MTTIKNTQLEESPSQTAGPYVHIGCTPNQCGVDGLYATDPGSVMIGPDTPGERITIEGRIYDGAGEPLRDAMVEIWQADHGGNYTGTSYGKGGAFTGWGRLATDLETGLYRFETIRPGPVEHWQGGMQAPHISFWIVARGIGIGLNTRMYFPDDLQNENCPVLSLVDPARRDSLIGEWRGKNYTFNIHLQGDNETVFFDI